MGKEVHPKLNYQVCGSSGCTWEHTSVVIDSNWRWTHVKGETTNCYTGNLWDPELCPDAATCSKNCEIEGADKEYNNTYGVSSSADGNSLSLKFVTEGPYTTNVGSRLYMLNAGSEDKYKMFRLKNREFTFTVDDSQIDCGLNGALYFVTMEQDGGAKRHGNSGAKYGTGYCDAQCPHDLKWINNEANMEDWVPSEVDENAGTGRYGTCCTEIDLWEANNRGTAFTMHSCATPNDEQYRCTGTDCGDNGEDRFKGVCDKNGCDIQPYRLKETKFWGVGKDFTIDSSKPVTVTTQFITDDNTDEGTIVEVKQFYTHMARPLSTQCTLSMATSTTPSQTNFVVIGLLRPRMAPISWKKVVLRPWTPSLRPVVFWSCLFGMITMPTCCGWIPPTRWMEHAISQVCAEALVPSPRVCQLMLRRIWQMPQSFSLTSNMATLVPPCR